MMLPLNSAMLSVLHKLHLLPTAVVGSALEIVAPFARTSVEKFVLLACLEKCALARFHPMIVTVVMLSVVPKVVFVAAAHVVDAKIRAAVSYVSKMKKKRKFCAQKSIQLQLAKSANEWANSASTVACRYLLNVQVYMKW